jgi:hypothetical protein
VSIVRNVRRLKIEKIAAVAIMAAFCFAPLGCSKQRADLSLKKANNNINTARSWDADKYDESKADFNAAAEAAKAAQSSMDGQQYPQALTSAQDAVKKSEAAINAAKVRFAEQNRTAAKTALDVANKNNGRDEDQKLFDEAQEQLTVAEEKLAKQKYEDSIEASAKAVSAVDQLLARLKNESEKMLEDLQTKRKNLEDAQANNFLPNSLININNAINQVEKKVKEERDYKQALIIAKAAATEADENLNETKKRHGKQLLETLESKIAEAISEEAPIYAAEQLKTTQESFESILKDFYDNQFDSVLDGAQRLVPKTDQLITITRIEATKDKIANVNSSITALKEQDVERYLPGRLQPIQVIATEAELLFNNNDYNGAKQKALDGLAERDRVVAAFDSLAEQTITVADQALNAATQTYEKMLSFFAAPATRVAAVDSRIEARRQSEATDLAARRKAAAENLDAAKNNRTQSQFKKAIEQGKEVAVSAESVMNGTFKIVAEHALLSVQDEISVLEREGARVEAPRQLNEVQALVEATQNLIRDNKNREAAEYTAKARAYLENVKQELSRRALEERDRADQMIRRLEGSAATREFPGGSDLNNKEAMFAEVEQLASEQTAPVQLAQTYASPNTVVPGPGGASNLNSNKQYPSGTYATDGPAGSLNYAARNTNEPNGAIIGTRPEPIVRTHENAGISFGNAPYEGANAPGPFVAVSAAPAGSAMSYSAGTGEVSDISAVVYEILSDDTRVRDIQKYEPAAVNEARAKLKESTDALVAQNYAAALTASKEAQRIIVEAEMRAAAAAARENLQAAADRINLAEVSSAAMFAPAQLMEAIKLFRQSEDFLTKGMNIEARDASQRAVIAADDARLYNVNKARDMASLSTRYGGWKAAHPPLLAAEQKASIAEDMLADPNTAAQGQALAQEAVVCAQIALDAARDFTFQERLDNIHKALNTALRAGANYFNVSEVKRLIAELAIARDEYNSRNFDAVELKLKDIEARLARVIESTPLVLQENLTDLTEKLNALVEAGAENFFMAQEVDDVKSLMNRSAIDFRKHDYQSSYTNLKNAMKLTDSIELRLQEQVYFDSVTELFAQLDKAFRNFSTVLNADRAMLKKLVTLPNGMQASINITGQASPNLFKDTVNDIYLRAIHLKPPTSQEGTHRELLVAIKYARTAAENFQKLYILDQVSRPDAYDIIETAFAQIDKSKIMRSEIQIKLIDPQARTTVIHAEKIVNY